MIGDIVLQAEPPVPCPGYEVLSRSANAARVALDPTNNRTGWANLIWTDGWATLASKPPGIPTVLDPSYEDTFQGRIRQLPSFEGYSPAHRLDLNTSGLVVGGNHAFSRRMLVRRFRDREVVKMYLALVEGVFPHQAQGFVDEPLLVKGRKTVVDRKRGRECLTEYLALDEFTSPYGPSQKLSLLLVRLHTGRRHQIRAHMAHLGTPLYGDPLYGRSGGQGQFLHATHLRVPRIVKWSHDLVHTDYPAWLLAGQMSAVREGINRLSPN